MHAQRVREDENYIRRLRKLLKCGEEAFTDDGMVKDETGHGDTRQNTEIKDCIWKAFKIRSRKDFEDAMTSSADAVLACVGGGSNAIGTFYNFIEDKDVRLIGCEAAGRGVNTAETAATIATGRLGIFHGMKSYFCQDEYGQIAPVYSISAGLDYPGVGPEHAHLYDIGRAEYVPVTDDEAVEAFEYLSRTEGIIPAIESAHAVAYAKKIAPTLGKDKIMVVTISGRGDKDCAAIARYRGEDIHE